VNNQTPISWFKEYPAQMTSSPKVIMLTASARGIYLFMRFHCWLNISDGGGIPNDDTYIQRIANCTAEEWQASKVQILKNFEERDGVLFDPALCRQSEEVFATAKVRSEAGRASGRARKKCANPHIETDDDETRQTDKTDKTDSMFTTCSTSVEQLPNTCSPPESPDASSGFTGAGISSPADSPTSGRIAAPTSGVPVPDSSNHPQDKGKGSGRENPDVQRLRIACVDCGGKLPNVTNVERLLATYSAKEIEDALREYAPQEDDGFLEYKFFVDGGAEAIIHARRKR
jgi:uncharacterized protein YdaU (DUF1376 family)